MKDSNYKNYSDLTLDELEALVQELENMSIVALKKQKKDLRLSILKSVKSVIKEIEKRLKK
tara:strand:- start:525 stop:707 length:183 start_codon:yes stop_codon:yes gene_type:complete